MFELMLVKLYYSMGSSQTGTPPGVMNGGWLQLACPVLVIFLDRRPQGGTTSRRGSSKGPRSIMRAGDTGGRINGPLELGLGAKEAAASVCQATGAIAVHLSMPLMSFAFSSWSDEGLFPPNLTPTPKISRKTHRLTGSSRRGDGSSRGIVGNSLATFAYARSAKEANGSALRAGDPWLPTCARPFSG